MGRPRTADNVRMTVTFSLDPQLVADLTACAKKQGTSRSALAELALTALVHGKQAAVEAVPVIVATDQTKPLPPKLAEIRDDLKSKVEAERSGCSHEWEHNPYLGTRCKHCGTNKPR